jgi:hypothetical protein
VEAKVPVRLFRGAPGARMHSAALRAAAPRGGA